MKTIELEEVAYSYQREKRISFPDLAVQAGEHIFIAGASGSGKTTLLGLLAGIHTASEGSVRVQGHDFKSMRSYKRDRFRADHIGYIFQQFNLIPYLSVYDNIALTVKMSTNRMKRLTASLDQEIRTIADKLHITELLGEQANAVSVGQAQRIACARAILGSPEIILADEPTSALDLENRHRFLELLFESVSPTTTVVFVSHDRSLESHFQSTYELKTLA